MARRRFDCKPLRGYAPEYGLMLAMMQDGTREWREELGRVGPDSIVWQPYANGYSIGGLMLHIADVEIYWLEEFCLGKMMTEEDAKLFMSKEIMQYKGQWPAPPRRPLSYYYKILDDVRARTMKAVKKMPAPDTVKARGTKFEFTMGWVLNHVVTHESYHGGQIVMMKELYRKLAK